MSKPDYSYESVQREYADTLCRIAPLGEKDAAVDTYIIRGPISLAKAIEIALSNNPDNLMAAARIEQAEADIEAANASFYPGLSFFTEYTKGDAPSAYLFKKIDQRALPPNLNFNDPGKFQNFESGVTARYNLYNGGRDILRRKMAETGLTVSQLDRQSVENALVASVISAYYNTLAAQAFIKIAQDSITTVDAQLRVMRVRFDAGGALKSDLLSLEVRLAQAKEEAVNSRNQWQTSLAGLANILGANPEPRLRLKGRPDIKVPIPEHYLGGVAYAVIHRPDLEKIRKEVVRTRMSVDMARAGYLPKVDLQGKYYLDDEDMAYELDRDNWTVGMVFNWEIFTGFSRSAQVKKSEAMLEEMLSADRKTALGVKLDVKSAYLNLEAAQARLAVAQKSTVAAEESLDLVRKQYEGGSATITRYLEAELDWNRARTRAAAAFYDREKAVAEIGRAIGYWAAAYSGKNSDSP